MGNGHVELIAHHGATTGPVLLWSANLSDVQGLSTLEVYDLHTNQTAVVLEAFSPPANGNISTNGTASKINPNVTVPFEDDAMGLANHMCMSAHHIIVRALTATGVLSGPAIYFDKSQTGLSCAQRVAGDSGASGTTSMASMSSMMPAMEHAHDSAP